jgi:hypothetical protein
MPSNEDTALCLKHAYGLIEEGWCQRAFHRRLGERNRYCAIGAVYAASQQLGSPARLEAELALTFSLGGYSVTLWNDDPSRKKKEVLELFERTIERITNGTGGA